MAAMAEQKQGESEQEPVAYLCMTYVCWRALATTLSLFFLSSCMIAWQTHGSIYRPTQTQLRVESAPQGKVYVNNKYIGLTPLEVPLEHGQEIEKKTRKVSY